MAEEKRMPVLPRDQAEDTIAKLKAKIAELEQATKPVETGPVKTFKVPREMHGQQLREKVNINGRWFEPGRTYKDIPVGLARTVLATFSTYADMYRQNLVNRGNLNQFAGRIDDQ